MRHASNALALLALLLAGCAAPGVDTGAPTPGSLPESVALRDVHGISASPSSTDVLTLATHDGIVRLTSHGAFVRIGESRDDFMGFTAHPTDELTYWVSGHPRGGGNMGVRRSTDGGETWTTVWAEPVDFHAMAVSGADPSLLWGHYRGALWRSDDGGVTWRALEEEAPLARALATHPLERETLYATTSSGIMVRRDGAWSTLAAIPAMGVAIDPTGPSTMYAGGSGALWKSVDAGATWTSLPAPGRGALAHLDVSPLDPRVVYVASYDAGVYVSRDAGATWTVLREPNA